MKEFFVFIMVSTLCTITTNGQNIYSIDGGINISKVTGYKSNQFNAHQGFQFGVYIDHIYANPIGFSTGLGFINKGFKKSNRTTSVNKDFIEEDIAELSTLYIPFLTTIHTNRFSLFAGPNIEILVKQDENFKEMVLSNATIIEYKTTHNYHQYNDLELGLTIGADIKLFRGISISSKYVQSLNAIGKNYNWQRLGTLQFSLKKSFGNNFKPQRLKQKNAEVETKKAYSVTYSKNLTGVEFRKRSEGNRVIFHIKGLQKKTFQIMNVSLTESSGQQRLTDIEYIIENVNFPFTGKINYTAINAVTGQETECAADVEILEKGTWDIYIDN